MWSLPVRVGAAGLVALVIGTVAPAAAVALPEAVVWSGGSKVGDSSRGVHLTAGGRLQTLRAGAGAISRGPVVKPSESEWRAIRDALATASRGPSYTRALEIRGGGYITAATTGVGVIAVGEAPVGLLALVDRINAALPAQRRLAPIPTVRRPSASVAVAPPASACLEGDPTRVTKRLSLEEAVRRGLVQLSAKGGNQGDVVRVDGSWKPVPGTVSVRIPVEFVQDRTPTAVEELAPLLAKKMSQTIKSGAYAGSRVNFELDFKHRKAGDPPTACYHQVRLVDHPRTFRSYVSDLGPKASGGEWSSNDPQAFPHELLHLAGFDDRYDDYFKVGRREIPLPSRGLEGRALAAELARSGVKPAQGRVIGKPHKGHEQDIMGDASKRITQDELNRLAEEAALEVSGDPGEILANKDAADQNMIVGRGLTFTIPYRNGIQLNGMEAYCIDSTKHRPEPGTRFDLLGPAAARSEPSFQALARIAKVIATRPPPEDFLGVDGAQLAIWRVSDDTPVEPGTAAAQLLQEAQVSADQTYAGLHLANPNAGSPDTGVTTDAGPLPPLPALTEASTPRKPSLARIGIVEPRPAAQRRGLLGIRAIVEGSGSLDQVHVSIRRLVGRKSRQISFSPSIALAEGQSAFSVPLPKLEPGRYQLVITAVPRGRRTVTFRLHRAPRGTAPLHPHRQGSTRARPLDASGTLLALADREGLRFGPVLYWRAALRRNPETTSR
jgi:hypothetical protein